MKNQSKKVIATFLIAATLATPISFRNGLNNRAIDAIASSLAATETLNDNDGVGNGVDKYTAYSGDGSTAAGWPSYSQWVSFENMWTNNGPMISQSCTEFGQANPSEQEMNDLHDSIQQVATDTKVDHRYILAIIMQESKGCIRVPTTNVGVSNPGLMQDHGGTGTCVGMNPCPKDNIVQMIHDGTAGTAGGDGLATLLGDSVTSALQANVAQGYYRAARAYNSGSVAASGQLQDGVATHCYASDIANRLVGWVKAQHDCPFDNTS